jgi:hypothetical protein
MQCENTTPTPDVGDARTVKFETGEYEAAHGKSPRGYAGWVFRPAATSPCDFDAMVSIFGTLDDAKATLAPGVWVVCP